MLINVAWLHMINFITKVTLVLKILRVLKIQYLLYFSEKFLSETFFSKLLYLCNKAHLFQSKGFEECWKV